MSDCGLHPGPSACLCIGLAAVLAVAVEFGAVVTEPRSSAPVVLVSPHVHGGGRDDFRLVIEETDRRVRVREDPASRRLPAACPSRHINLDGTFCLGWDAEDPSSVRDTAGAHEWWTTLLVFLRYQRYVDIRRVWPQGRERAHGPEAAEFQSHAEWLASQFGPSLLADLRAGRVSTRRAGRTVRLDRDGSRLFALADGSRSVVNLRQACPCSTAARPTVLKACGCHAAAAQLLIVALSRQERFEAEFHEAFARVMHCCGTIDGCPLAAPAGQG